MRRFIQLAAVAAAFGTAGYWLAAALAALAAGCTGEDGCGPSPEGCICDGAECCSGCNCAPGCSCNDGICLPEDG